MVAAAAEATLKKLQLKNNQVHQLILLKKLPNQLLIKEGETETEGAATATATEAKDAKAEIKDSAEKTEKAVKKNEFFKKFISKFKKNSHAAKN